jgi:hypothetical protein
MRPVWSGEEAPRGRGLLESERDRLGPLAIPDMLLMTHGLASRICSASGGHSA